MGAKTVKTTGIGASNFLPRGLLTRKVPEMRLVQINDFSLSTAAEYQQPVAFSEARLEEVAKALCAVPLGSSINATEISLTKQNELFAYTLFVPLFNGAGSITIDAQRITVAFKQGRNKGHLDLMIDCTLSAFNLVKAQPLKRSFLSFMAHAVFDPPTEYTEHMKRYTSLSAGMVSGGVVLVTALPEIDGELRYASEKSLALENAVFIAANASTTKEITKDLFEFLGNRLEATAHVEGICFRKT